MNFVLFLILNAILLLRPDDLFPELAGVRLYLIAIVACVAASLPALIARLTPDALRQQPIGVCVLGLWAAGTLSLLVYRFRTSDAMDFAGEFGKVVLYYFLLIAVVDTVGRFRAFVGWLVLCVLTSASLATLDFEGYIDLAAIEHARQGAVNLETGEDYEFYRLAGSGVFSDPNDLCLALSFGMLSCLYLTISGRDFTRFFWLLPIVPMFYTLTLTHSRGGLLGLLVGVGAWLFARYGGKRAVPLAILAAVGLLGVVGGRQASIGGGGTAHERLMWWAQGFVDLQRAPMYIPFGFGVNYFPDEVLHVAHNSFVSTYIETGLLGGGFFLGAFYIAGRLTHRLGRDGSLDDWTRQTRPFVFAAIVAYAGGMYSLSREYVVPTYLVLGLASAFVQIACPVLPDRFQVSQRWWLRLAGVSVAGFIALRLMTQFMGQIGV